MNWIWILRRKNCENPFVDFFLLQLSHTHAQLRIWNLYFGYFWYTCLLKHLLLAKKLSKLLTVGHIIQELLKAVNSSFELSKLSKVLIELKQQIPRSVVHLATFDSLSLLLKQYYQKVVCTFNWIILVKKRFIRCIQEEPFIFLTSKKSSTKIRGF